jgi:hypothetical protein
MDSGWQDNDNLLRPRRWRQQSVGALLIDLRDKDRYLATCTSTTKTAVQPSFSLSLER